METRAFRGFDSPGGTLSAGAGIPHGMDDLLRGLGQSRDGSAFTPREALVMLCVVLVIGGLTFSIVSVSSAATPNVRSGNTTDFELINYLVSAPSIQHYLLFTLDAYHLSTYFAQTEPIRGRRILAFICFILESCRSVNSIITLAIGNSFEREYGAQALTYQVERALVLIFLSAISFYQAKLELVNQDRLKSSAQRRGQGYASTLLRQALTTQLGIEPTDDQLIAFANLNDTIKLVIGHFFADLRIAVLNLGPFGERRDGSEKLVIRRLYHWLKWGFPSIVVVYVLAAALTVSQKDQFQCHVTGATDCESEIAWLIEGYLLYDYSLVTVSMFIFTYVLYNTHVWSKGNPARFRLLKANQPKPNKFERPNTYAECCYKGVLSLFRPLWHFFVFFFYRNIRMTLIVMCFVVINVRLVVILYFTNTAIISAFTGTPPDLSNGESGFCEIVFWKGLCSNEFLKNLAGYKFYIITVAWHFFFAQLVPLVAGLISIRKMFWPHRLQPDLLLYDNRSYYVDIDDSDEHDKNDD